jgi:hypothetical protein
MGYLTRQQILDAQDVTTISVHVPEWANGTGDDHVLVRGLTVAERDKMLKVWNESPVEEHSALLCSLAVIDEKGEKLFTPADVVALKAKSYRAVDRVLRVALNLSGMAEGAQEEAEKKS